MAANVSPPADSRDSYLEFHAGANAGSPESLDAALMASHPVREDRS